MGPNNENQRSLKTVTRRIPERLNEIETKLDLHLAEDILIHKKIFDEMAINTEITRKTAKTGEENKLLMTTIADNTTELVAIAKGGRLLARVSKWILLRIRKIALYALPILTVVGLVIEWLRYH